MNWKNTTPNIMKKAKLLLVLFVGIVAANASAETVTYYATDQLGSPIAAMDSSGSLLWWESYNPYGEKRRSPSSANGDTGYTGHQHDTATGLTYMQARYYDPVIGRFLANDPVGFAGHLNGTQGPQGFNRYAYVNNNPYKYTDPDGKEGDDPYGDNFNPLEAFRQWADMHASMHEKLEEDVDELSEAAGSEEMQKVGGIVGFVPTPPAQIFSVVINGTNVVLNDDFSGSAGDAVGVVVSAATRGKGDVVEYVSTQGASELTTKIVDEVQKSSQAN